MKYTVLIIFILFLSACGVPKNFTMRYSGEDTRLADKIDINGYYVSPHGCDSSFFSLYMFYPDGLFLIATTSEISPELIDCFLQGGKSTVCDYPLWGLYEVVGDTIKTQVLRSEGGGCVIFRDYQINVSTRKIQNISDYVEPSQTNLGYMKNYPSFYNNKCSQIAKFYPMSSKRTSKKSFFKVLK